jgi:Fe-S cluster biogenesis protein NfuA
MGLSTADFASPVTAVRSPLATELFALPGVARVFLGGDFISVTRNNEISWQALKPQVLGVIMDHFVAGRPVIEGAEAGLDEEDVDEADREVVDQIKELLDTRVRPAVAGDGGDIVFRGYREGVVRLHMQGSCSGCPSSSATLKHGIENMLKHYVPEVVAVEQVEF